MDNKTVTHYLRADHAKFLEAGEVCLAENNLNLYKNIYIYYIFCGKIHNAA